MRGVCGRIEALRARFTIVELMIAVAIVMVLSAIAIPMVHNYQLQAKRAELPLNTWGFADAVTATRMSVDDIVADIMAQMSGDMCIFVPRDFTAIDKVAVDWPAQGATDCDLWGHRPDGAVRCSYIVTDTQIRVMCDMDDDNNPQVIELLWDGAEDRWVPSSPICGDMAFACDVF